MMLNIVNNVKQLFTSPDKWVIRNNDSSMDIETCGGTAVYDEETRSCAICVALNKTIFLNDKKPNYSHPHCKCSFNEVYLNKIKLDLNAKKIIDYLFQDINKYAMMRSMGYDKEDGALIYATIVDAIEREFLLGNYKLKNLDEHGQRIGVFFVLDGKRYCEGKRYRCHIGCVVYPNGKLHVSSPIIKDKEIKA